jgi:hypothetical protein
MADVSEPIPLAKWVQALRAELEQAQQEGAGRPLHFAVGPLELEFEMAVSREGGGQGGIRFWVVELGASAKHTGQKTQRVKMTLTPKTASGESVDVEDQLRQVPE